MSPALFAFVLLESLQWTRAITKKSRACRMTFLIEIRTAIAWVF
jgi:hypothetical protein